MHEISVYAPDVEKIEDVDELKGVNNEDVKVLKIVQSETLISMEVHIR